VIVKEEDELESLAIMTAAEEQHRSVLTARLRIPALHCH
jgi:hypothetical protein